MEGVVISSFLNFFLPKLWDVITQGHGRSYEIRRDIKYIEDELSFVDACIRKHILHCVSPSSELSQVMKKARRLAEDTEQCIRSFLSQPTHQACKISHLQFAQQINDLRGKMETIIKDISSLEQGPTISPEEPEDLHYGEGEFVGMVVPRQELRELLGQTGKVKVISIAGFGGSGKTRLAQKVCEEARTEFDTQACVHMGLKRNVNEVLMEILRMVSTGVEPIDNGAGASTDGKERLKSWLGKKRYLIVIDDVRSTDGWDTLMDVLPDSDVGSRIIVTTTSQPVAECCSYPSGHVYKMSTLSDQESRELFWSVLTGKISESRKKQFSQLIDKCDGLPLALIESAKPFKRKREVHNNEFQKALRNICVPEEGSNGILTRMQWVLMNNYSGLTSYGARVCLLYFHMFPFDNPRKRKFLTRQWLAEGIVEKHDTNFSDLDAASKHLKTLSDGNIIRSTEVSNNSTVKSCRLPGTMHQFISCQSLSQNFATFLHHGYSEPPEPSNVRRLSLHDGAANSEKCIEGVDAFLLRTLAVSGKACKAIVDFSKYKGLRVLDLKEWDYHPLDDEAEKLQGKAQQKLQIKLQEELQEKLRDICKLDMLKYLGLPGGIGMVPREIADLIELETLDLGRTGEEIVTLFGEVIQMPKLKHILGRFILFPSNSAKDYLPIDSRLETISGFVTNGKGTFPELMIHMNLLTKVKMWCNFKAGEAELKHLLAAINKFTRTGTTAPTNIDRSLSIDVAGCKVRFLESLEAPGSLTKLKLHGSLEKVPELITPKMVQVVTPTTTKVEFITPLTGLTELCLSFTTLCGKLSLFPFPLEDGATLLPSLRCLKLVEDDLGPLKILPKHFPSLERICLVGKKSLNGITIEAGALDFLVSLHIMCKALDGLAGIEIKDLSELKEIALDSEVSEATKDAWKVAARGHPNKPQVLFIEANHKP